jgi:hypothetical protein
MAEAQPSKLQLLPSSSTPERRWPSLPRRTGENPPLVTASRCSAAGLGVAHCAQLSTIELPTGSWKKKTETQNCQLSYIVLVDSSNLKIHIK